MTNVSVHPVALGPDQFGNTEIFSAFYSLGCLTSFAKAYENGRLRDSFEFEPITPREAREIPEMVSGLADGPRIVLLSSYVWNHRFNMEFAKRAKERSPETLVVVGGPHIPRQPEPAKRFFRDHPYVDVAVRHEGEVALAELLDAVGRSAESSLNRVDLSDVRGLTFRRNGDIARTQDRGLSRDLTAFPSPYTTGEYDHWILGRSYAPLETNRGCPYGCTFCDWGAATLSKISRMSLERVLEEVEFAGRNRIHTIGFCDANFGILPRDLDIVRHVVKTKERWGYPREVGYTNAKTAKPRLGEIIKLLRDNGLTAAAQISMQTTDEHVLKNVERANIKTSEYRKMIEFFHQEGIPAVSDMMLGLPGQTFETCKADLQFFFDHKVLAVLFATSVMPNAPMADEEYRRKFRIELDADGMVESTYSFTREDYAKMFDLCLAYKLFVKLGLLRYFLYYVQIEHGVKAMDFIAHWLEKVSEGSELYPISSKIRSDLLGRDYRGGRKDWLVLFWTDAQGRFLFDSLSDFQQEIVRFFAREYDVELGGSAVEAVLTANREVMPRKDRPTPANVPLAHDVPGYFAALRKLPNVLSAAADHVPLSSRPPGSLELRAPTECSSYQYADFGLTFGALELQSNLAI